MLPGKPLEATPPLLTPGSSWRKIKYCVFQGDAHKGAKEDFAAIQATDRLEYRQKVGV